VGSEQPATTPERDRIEDTVDAVIDDAIHDRVEGASAEGLDRGVDVDRATGGLPPGQSPTARFPVVGEARSPPEALDLDAWRLTLDGLVARPRRLTYGDVLALGSRRVRLDVHCVTGWTRFSTTFTGVRLADVLALAGGAVAGARFARFEAYSARGHDTSLPLPFALDECWLVHGVDGAPLAPEHGWPLRVVTPSRYFYKSVKWVRRVELLAEDRLGYWERESAYHNVGDPWPGDQRFTSGSLRPRQAAAFRGAASYDKYRGRVLIGLDLRGWRPAAADLRGLQLKGCDLRHASLAGADLRAANLSLSDLREADLRGADLRDADVEGADLREALLSGADLRGAACSATMVVVAVVDGVRWSGATGLLEADERWLQSHAM
jgi:DMSO/TMAO reductase YedYZ molybdopterin-dependent catalytic subunit